MSGTTPVSRSEFNENLELRNQFGSDYESYVKAFNNALKKTSLMTFARNNFMGSWLPEKVRNDIWAHSKAADKQKVKREEEYTIALKAEQAAEEAKDKAERELERVIRVYGENHPKVQAARVALAEAEKCARYAECDRGLAGEKMVDSSKWAYGMAMQAHTTEVMLDFKS